MYKRVIALLWSVISTEGDPKLFDESVLPSVLMHRSYSSQLVLIQDMSITELSSGCRRMQCLGQRSNSSVHVYFDYYHDVDVTCYTFGTTSDAQICNKRQPFLKQLYQLQQLTSRCDGCIVSWQNVGMTRDYMRRDISTETFVKVVVVIRHSSTDISRLCPIGKWPQDGPSTDAWRSVIS